MNIAGYGCGRFFLLYIRGDEGKGGSDGKGDCNSQMVVS